MRLSLIISTMYTLINNLSIMFLCLLIMCRTTMAQSSDVKTLEMLGFLPMSGKGWVGGGACLPAILMALRHVNERPDVLDGYNLTYFWVDTQVIIIIFLSYIIT